MTGKSHERRSKEQKGCLKQKDVRAKVEQEAVNFISERPEALQHTDTFSAE